jgi:putative addiction module killer protein
MELEIRHYRSRAGRDVYQDWMDGLRDPRGKTAVMQRLVRVERGNFGDHASCRDGVSELRIDVGPGYRVYFGIDRGVIVLLLGGGDKSSQRRDIDRAVDAWRDYQRRTEHDEAMA